MKFLKVLGLMSILFTTASTYAESKHQKIVVIGAGLAGLTTAYRLQQHGANVHVYEARNRIGGRVFTAKIGDTIIELGGQNITDGGEAKNLMRLIEEFNLELVARAIGLAHGYFDGQEIIPVMKLLKEKKFKEKHLRKQLDELASKSQNMSQVLSGIFEKDSPLYKTFATRLAAFEGAPVENLSSCYVETLYYMLLGGIASVHQSHGEEELFINFVTINKGNAVLLEKMAKTLKDKLHLNKPLVKLSKEADGSHLLTFQDGEEVKADILVLAMPCSVYKDIVFEKGVIPDAKLAAIRNIQYGTNAKITFPLTRLPTNSTGLVSDRAICFFDPCRSVVTLYYTGDAGYFSADTILDTYKLDQPMVERGFGDAIASIDHPTAARDEFLGVYSGPVGHSWLNDPYARGSYSCIAPGQEEIMTAIETNFGESVKKLFAPLDQKLYFAGEHASILIEAPGTMEAACESGERVARMIVKSLK